MLFQPHHGIPRQNILDAFTDPCQLLSVSQRRVIMVSVPADRTRLALALINDSPYQWLQ